MVYEDMITNPWSLKFLVNGSDVDIFGSPLDLSAVASSNLFKGWLNSLSPKFKVTAVRIDAVAKSGDAVRSIEMIVSFIDDGLFTQHRISLFEPVVVIMPIIFCDGKKYTLLVKQKRVATGQAHFYELPAGRMETPHVHVDAARELREETGLKVDSSLIVELTTLPIFLSPGVSNEHVRICYCEVKLSRRELDEMQDREAGLKSEHEKTKVLVVNFSDLTRYVCEDAKSLAAYSIYKDYFK